MHVLAVEWMKSSNSAQDIVKCSMKNFELTLHFKLSSAFIVGDAVA